MTKPIKPWPVGAPEIMLDLLGDEWVEAGLNDDPFAYRRPRVSTSSLETLQSRINELTPTKAEATIVACQDYLHAPYPQYLGRHNRETGYRLYRAVKNWYKHGVYHMRVGDLVIARYRQPAHGGFSVDGDYSVYLCRTEHGLVAEPKQLQEVVYL